MADVKISALPASTTPLAGTEVLPIVQGGQTKQVSIANVTAGRAVSAASLALTTTPLAVGSGGTGLNTLTAGYIPYGNGTGALSSSSNFNYDGNNFSLNAKITIASSQTFIGDAGYIAGTGADGNTAICYFGSKNLYFNVGATATKMALFSSGGVSIGNTTDPGAGNLKVTGTVTGSVFSSASGTTASTASGTPVTFTTVPSVPTGVWLVTGSVVTSASSWVGVYLLKTEEASATLTPISAATSALTITMSGLSIQGTQISGASLPMFWSITRIV